MSFNALSTIANLTSLFHAKEPLYVKFINKLGSYATKLFYIVNSAVNFKGRMKVNDIMAAMGHGFDIVLSMIAKQSDLFMLRGLSVGMYMFANGVKDALQKYKFKDIFEHFRDTKFALKKGVEFMRTGFWKNFKSSKTGLQSMLAGCFLLIGPLVWKITGSRLLGASIRNFGATMQDVSQLKPDFILNKAEQKENTMTKLHLSARKALGLKKSEGNLRPFYFRSGLAYVVGTLSDWSAKLLNALGYSEALVKLFESSLTYLFDSLGVYLQGLAQEHEVGQKFND